MPEQQHPIYDAAIIGGGPAGYSAALRIAQLGGKACLIEKDKVGGTCATVGCIPTKALSHLAEFSKTAQQMKALGIRKGGGSWNFQKVQAHIWQIVADAVAGIQWTLKNQGIPVIRGTAVVTGKNEVAVLNQDGKAETSLVARNIVLATGSSPRRLEHLPPILSVITSDEVLSLEALPKTLGIIGGGYIGLEFASIFSALGTKVHLIEALPTIAPTEEPEIADAIQRFLKKSGVEVITNATIGTVQETKCSLSLTIISGNDCRSPPLQVEKLLVAVGRVPNLPVEELHRLGISYTPAGISVNAYLETNVPGVYAIGDVISTPRLAHVGIHEGRVAAENIMGKRRAISYATIPSCMYTVPEVASIGQREGSVGRCFFLANGKAKAMHRTEGFIKVYLKQQKLVGAAIVGWQASELLGVVAGFLGEDVEEIKQKIIAHPTLSEMIPEALIDAGRQVSSSPKPLWS
ncbi:dihydrolipoyl dehydrogenase [Candidatus Woesearchaeota archaeon]|nr:dihydrolipoyl dehydrogenase [Candidatus Woesearchaeota archaeon]